MIDLRWGLVEGALRKVDYKVVNYRDFGSFKGRGKVLHLIGKRGAREFRPHRHDSETAGLARALGAWPEWASGGGGSASDGAGGGASGTNDGAIIGTNIALVCSDQISSVLSQLSQILTSGPEICLETLYIGNISLFYWKLKLENALFKYVELGQLLRQVANKYHCNVVVTSWSDVYDRGWGYRGDQTNNSVPSFIPSGYFNWVDLIYIQGDDELS